jgi:uncharacterized cupredoxin-like copper-binding protein
MKLGRVVIAPAVILAVAAAIFLWSRSGSPGGGLAYGEPGDPAQAARTFEIELREKPDGRMNFFPDSLQAARGAQVRIVLRNEGQLSHTLALGMPGQSASSTSVTVPPSQSGELLWRFTQAGEFELFDADSKNRAAGLEARISVR